MMTAQVLMVVVAGTEVVPMEAAERNSTKLVVPDSLSQLYKITFISIHTFNFYIYIVNAHEESYLAGDAHQHAFALNR